MGTQPLESEVQLNTSAARIVGQIAGMRGCITLQEATEAGAQHQRRCDGSCTVVIMHHAVSGKSRYWNDLAGDPPDPCGFQTADGVCRKSVND